MKQIKVAEATGAALNWLVAKCEGGWILEMASFVPNHHLGRMRFSTDWSQGGPIIDAMMKEGLTLSRGGPCSGNTRCWAKLEGHPGLYSGPTLLIAAMRCYVASKLGDTVEVPEELL